MMSVRTRWLRVGWLLTMGILVVGYVVLLQYLRFGLPGVPYASNTALLPVGWPELSRRVERQKQALLDAGSQRVLIVGMDRDFLASETAFYQTDQTRAVRETTGAHLFEGRSLMYTYWFPPSEQEGATLLLVSFQRDKLMIKSIPWHCEPLGPIEEHSIQVSGRPVCTYYTRAAYHYRSAVYHPSQ